MNKFLPKLFTGHVSAFILIYIDFIIDYTAL